MRTAPHGGGPGRKAPADRTPRSIQGPHVGWLLKPWGTGQVADFLGCTERQLRELRRDPEAGFPDPLHTPRLGWWPADVLAWCGLGLDEVLPVARRHDLADPEAPDLGVR